MVTPLIDQLLFLPAVVSRAEPDKMDCPKPPTCFKDLVYNSKGFFAEFPTTENRIEAIAGDDKEKREAIFRHAVGTRIIVHEKVVKLIDRFLSVKQNYGSEKEKVLYSSMTTDAFIQRLFVKRPLVFMNSCDQTVLRDGKVCNSCRDWLRVGTQNEGIIHLEDYLSYDEMQVSALLGASTPTFFINDGNRYNIAVKGAPGTFEEFGIILGLVGARFEKAERMEHQHMVISEKYSVPENGFGRPAAENDGDTLAVHGKGIHNRKLLEAWAEFYEIGSETEFYFPSFDQVENNASKYAPLFGPSFFNVEVYVKRMKITAETLFLEANSRGEEAVRKVYVHVVGFGLGVWKLMEKQGELLVQSFVQVLRSTRLPRISVVDFSWFRPETHTDLDSGTKITSASGNEIVVLFSKRNTADKVSGQELLVTTYAWDSNSFPGNEYWRSSLAGSSDPAAACCSSIPELQNPYVNPFHLNINVLSSE